jgi:hypothetical protein
MENVLVVFTGNGFCRMCDKKDGKKHVVRTAKENCMKAVSSLEQEEQSLILGGLGGLESNLDYIIIGKKRIESEPK